jgi:hypothetical protein
MNNKCKAAFTAPKGLNIDSPVQVQRSGTPRGVTHATNLSRGAVSLHSEKPLLRAKSRGCAYTLRLRLARGYQNSSPTGFLESLNLKSLN